MRARSTTTFSGTASSRSISSRRGSRDGWNASGAERRRRGGPVERSCGAMPSPLPDDALACLAAICGECALVVFDLETTGADRLTDRIVEIAAIRFRKGAPVESFERRVNPGVRIPRESTAVHGIGDDDVRALPLFAAIAAEVGAFFE